MVPTSPGAANTRLSGFSCVSLEVPVYRIHRYCSQKVLLEGLRILKAQPEQPLEVGLELTECRKGIETASEGLSQLTIEKETRALYDDILKKFEAIPGIGPKETGGEDGSEQDEFDEADEDSFDDDEEEIELLDTNEELMTQFDLRMSQRHQEAVLNLWAFFQARGMDDRVRQAASRAYELAEEIGTLLHRGVD